MPIQDKLTLIGILVVLVTTAVGWIFTYQTQAAIRRAQTKADQDLAVLQSQLATSRDLSLRLIDDRLSVLSDLEAWAQLGRELFLDAQSFAAAKDRGRTAQEILTFRDRVHPRLRTIRAEAPRLYYLAKTWSALPEGATRWQWGSKPLPSDLPQLMNAYEDEILDQVFEGLLGASQRDHPFIENQSYEIHEALVKAIQSTKTQALRTEQP